MRNFASRERGITRGCIIGCVAVAGIIAVIAIGLGFYGYRLYKENVDFGFIDVAGKNDPPAGATTDELLPLAAGPYTRDSISTDTTGTLESAMPFPMETEMPGTAVATYSGPDGNTFYVTVASTAEAEEARVGGEGPFADARAPKGQEDMGVHMSLKFGPEPQSVVTWSKPNWTYVVHTTSTAATVFVESFNPGITAGAPSTTGTAGVTP